MASSYTSLLGLVLPVQGELQGTWGDTVNNELTSLLDTAIAGTTTLSTDADVTLTDTDGAANQARQAIILWTANGSTTRNITAPAQSKTYVVINKSAGTQSIVIRGVGPTSGVTVLKGEQAVVAWDGADFVKVSTFGGSPTFTDVTVSGNLTLSAGTANGVAYLNGSKVLTSGSALTFDGTNFATTGASTGLRLIASSTDAGGSVLQVDTTATAYGRIGGSTTMGYVADTQSLWTIGGSEQMRLTSTGLGIGTSSPSSKLHVAGQIEVTTDTTTPTAGSAYFYKSSVGATVSGFSAVIETGSAGSRAERLRIDSSGNLGIGTSSPSNKLHVTVSAASTAVAAFYNTDTADGNGVYIKAGGSNSGKYALAIDNAASSSLLFLDASGNLGIGTSSPNYKLDVVGPINVQGTATFPTTGLMLRSGDNQLKIVGGSAGIAFAAASGASTYATLDSSGNLGLGVTPSAWRSTTQALQIGSTSSFQNFDNGGVVAVSMGSNFYWNSSDQGVYIQSRAATNYYQANGQHVWQTAPSGTAGSAISFTQAMTLDASGRLLVGVTSASGNAALQIKGATSGYARLEGTSSTLFAGDAGLLITGAAAADSGVRAEGALLFASGGATERARITSGGDLLVGTTSAVNLGRGIAIEGSNSCGTTLYVGGTLTGYWYAYSTGMRCESASGKTIEMVSGGTNGVSLANGGTSWGSLSDERKKDIIEPITNAAQKLSSLRSVIGKYKTDSNGTRRAFLIAQDVQSVLPEAVVEATDGSLILQYTETIPLLVAAIKEQQALITALTARVAALESN